MNNNNNNNNKNIEYQFIAKLTFKDDTRRFGVIEKSYDGLMNTIKQVIGDSEKLRIRYKDEDGDLISFNSDEELLEALSMCQSNNVLRLFANVVKQPVDQFVVLPTEDADRVLWSNCPIGIRKRLIARHNTATKSGVSVDNDDDFAHFEALPPKCQQRCRERAEQRKNRQLNNNNNNNNNNDDNWNRHGRWGAHHGKGRFGKFGGNGGFGAWKARRHSNITPNIQLSIEDQEKSDIEMWNKIPNHIRRRIVTRWMNDSIDEQSDISHVSFFQALPSHVQHRVRKRSAFHQSNNDRNNEAFIKVVHTIEQDREMWINLPAHVRKRITSRWLTDDVTSVMSDVEFVNFELLPEDVKQRVRQRAAKHANDNDDANVEEQHHGRRRGGCRRGGRGGRGRFGFGRFNRGGPFAPKFVANQPQQPEAECFIPHNDIDQMDC